ncbi:MAG: UDP-N-acetylglucosamine--N-acetylmuramyl-(pentapeptide) pyrophosphoryl-undecaprenol N-acetylglucosamine transferase [Methylacidiphilales bacterium]|nr:UDP-N-acetylglucosamine--N-acetylmuramyl-(pentapeptide) pyrophosphoryl-undecaprenol N-acetylglucosamine transferase [Candidatus Methylacidiphilales bacterium]MDW8349795.1 UDP-N-acetylglucosamine--N-acetylmuramyl-(pentapeptide) pyrophosphoryl-undecaprenol N-acetylglucosamine transferase [Verrucomicrobiae bacterium]
MKNNIWIACGGTGGHLYPGIAVAEVLISRGNQVRLIISKKPVDQSIMEEFPTIPTECIPMIGWPGWKSLKALLFFSAYLKTRRQLSALAAQEPPTLILAMGGFTSIVPLEIGNKLQVPCIIHESNVMPGKVTRLWADRVDRILVGWRETMDFLGEKKTQHTGTPLRHGLNRIQRTEAAKRLELDPHKKTVLLMGGSQGARSLNALMFDALPYFAKYRDQWQFIHITGPDDLEKGRHAYSPYGFSHKVFPYLHTIQDAYSLADLVISRAGAASLTEIAAFGLPSVLVPFPYAADDHQTHNARIFSDSGAALLCHQPERTPNARGAFATMIIDLMEDAARRKDMSSKAEKLFRGRAAEAVADVVEELHEMKTKAITVKV